MKDLYIDFDGVIMNTNDKINSLICEFNINKNNYDETFNFLSKIKWNQVLKESNEISNAFNNIKKLSNSGIYNVSILTHVCSEEEGIEKRKLINEKVGDILVISVPRNEEKCFYVNPKNAILIDDYSKNLELWEKHGGIGIKFTNKHYDKFKSIYNLADILDNNNVS